MATSSPNKSKLPAASRDAALPPDAAEQVRLIAGNADATVRLRAICSRAGADQRRAEEREGRLTDLAAWAAERNAGGFNVYMVAQALKASRDTLRFVRDADVDAVRVLFADGDEKPEPTDWHVPPTFRLHHANGRWWAFWSVAGVEVADLRELQQRIALHYGSDKSVCNPARIVRLAGFDRWKDGGNHGAYRLIHPSDDKSEGWMHEGLPKLPPRTEYRGDPNSPHVISLGRLRGLLDCISSDDRDDWRNVCFAMRDATVIDDRNQVVDDFDVLRLFDEWSSRSAKYQGADDCEVLWEGSRGKTATPKTVASLVYMAKRRGAPEELCRPAPAERMHGMFTAVARPANNDNAPASGKDAPEGPVKRSTDGKAGITIERPYFRFATRAEMDRIEPPSWLVPDMLPADALAILAAAPDTYKTFLALDTALSVATGALGGLCAAIEKPGPVLFAVGEGRSNLPKRVAAWERTYLGGRRADNFVLVDPVPPAGEPGRWDELLAQALTLHPNGYRLVVIDTVARSMQGLNENAQEHASKFTKLADTLRRELGGATILALHHSGHDDKDKAQGRPKGSMEFIGAPDTIFTVEKVGDCLLNLSMTKQKDADKWKEPRTIKLTEVPLTVDSRSLVVSQPHPREKATADAAIETKRRNRAPKGDPRNLTLSVLQVDMATIAALRTISSCTELSTNRLSGMVAAQLGTGTSAQTIRKNYFDPHLKVNDAYESKKCWDAARGVSGVWIALGPEK